MLHAAVACVTFTHDMTCSSMMHDVHACHMSCSHAWAAWVVRAVREGTGTETGDEGSGVQGLATGTVEEGDGTA